MEKFQIILEGFWLISQNFFHLPIIALVAMVIGAARE
jgi:hypothetical protein